MLKSGFHCISSTLPYQSQIKECTLTDKWIHTARLSVSCLNHISKRILKQMISHLKALICNYLSESGMTLGLALSWGLPRPLNWKSNFFSKMDMAPSKTELFLISGIHKGTYINYVSTFSAIFDTPLPHVIVTWLYYSETVASGANLTDLKLHYNLNFTSQIECFDLIIYY